jgi:hypothetical protein
VRRGAGRYLERVTGEITVFSGSAHPISPRSYARSSEWSWRPLVRGAATTVCRFS